MKKSLDNFYISRLSICSDISALYDLFYASMEELYPTIILHVEFATISKTDLLFEIILARQYITELFAYYQIFGLLITLDFFTDKKWIYPMEN